MDGNGWELEGGCVNGQPGLPQAGVAGLGQAVALRKKVL